MHSLVTKTLACSLLFMVAACDSSVSSPPAASVTSPRAVPSQPRSPQSNLMGMNVDFPGDYSGTRMFADAMKQSRGWQKIGADQGAVLDSNGWPLEDARLTVWHGIGRMNGTYRLSFLGQAEVRIECCAGALQSVRYDPATNLTTANLIYPTSNDSGLFLAFTKTRRTATSPENSGIADVRLMRPIVEGGSESYPAETLFTTPFKAALKRFKVLRFMDFLATNSNAQVQWGDRLTPSWYSMYQNAPGYGWQGKGGAYEYAIALCNELNTDCWLTVPAQADDAYVQQLATLVKAQLKPTLKLYLEYSNEVWNTAPAFRQSQHNYALAKAEVASGRSPLNFDGTTNDWYWAWRRIAKRGAEVSLIFRQVFGDAAMMTRIRPVLMTQLGHADGPLLQAMHLMQGYYNSPQVSRPRPPRYYFYGLGGSAYYNPKDPSSPDTLFADLSNAEQWVKALRQDADYAAAFGLKRIAYEGGPSLENGAITDANRSLYRDDSRITAAMVNAHDIWSANGGDLLMYFTITGESPWSFVRDIWDATNPQKNYKLQAIDALNKRPRAAVSYGTLLPATIDARQFNLPPSWLDDRRVERIRPGQWFSYTVRVAQAGTFLLRLKATGLEQNSAVEVWVDGKLAVSLEVPAASWLGSTPQSEGLSLPLQEGLHGILLRGKTGSINVSQIDLSVAPSR